MKIEKVKKIGQGYLINGTTTVPNDENNRHYKMVQEWIKNSGVIEEESVEETLIKARVAKITEFSKLCEREIVNGFKSSALGEPHYYQSKKDDQLNLIGVITAGEDTIYKCSLDNQTWEYKEHTIAQLKQILSDGKAIKSSLLQKFNTLKNQILNIVSIEELEGIKW